MARTPDSLPPMQAPPPMAQPIAPPPQIMQQDRPSLLEAIAAASAGFGELVKDSKNDYLKSQYLALPGLLKAIKPALLEQGVVIYSQVLFANSAWIVRTTLSFADGSEELASDFPIPDLSSQQKIGAVVTYGTRYNLFALLAICPENDDDGNSGGYAAPAAQSLPGLPGGQASWPLPGQQMQAPQAMYQQAAPMPPAIAYPAQPLPVLQ
jgi:hypothetical protein